MREVVLVLLQVQLDRTCNELLLVKTAQVANTPEGRYRIGGSDLLSIDRVHRSVFYDSVWRVVV